MTLDAILSLLGNNNAAVARLLGVAPSAISNWRAVGSLPPARAIQIAQLARRRGMQLSVEDLPITGAEPPRRRGRPKGQRVA